MNPKALLVTIAGFLAGGLQAVESAGTSVAIERLGSLPGLSRLTESELRQFAPGTYSGAAKLHVLPNGRYFYFVWSESGPSTHYYDTGNWAIRDGLVELAAEPTNMVLKNAGKSFLILKTAESHGLEAFAVEVGSQDDRLVAEIKRLRERPGSAWSRPQTAAIAILRLLDTSPLALRRGTGSERAISSLAPVLEAQNRLASTTPTLASPIAEFQQRARLYVPTLTGVPNAAIRDVAGHYAASWGMGSQDLYLLPDGGYYYREAGDLPTTTKGYDKGNWAIRDGVVELTGAASSDRTPKPAESRFFVLRAPLPVEPNRGGSAADRLILVGTTKEAGSFLSSAAEHQAAVLADHEDTQAETNRRYSLFVLLGQYNSVRWVEPISAADGAALRRTFDAEDRADAAAWQAQLNK